MLQTGYASEAYIEIYEQGSSGGVPDARQLLQQVQGQLQTSWPQLQPLMDMPGAIEMRAELLASLSQRFFARTIKMILGPQVRLLGYIMVTMS